MNDLRSDQRAPLEGGIVLFERCHGSRATHHGNGVRGEKLLGTHGRDVGDVGEDVDEGHEGDGDENGARKVPGDDRNWDV